MLAAPSIYAEWALLVERFSAGEDTVLDVMERGTIAWTNVVAERFTLLVTTALDRRLIDLSQRLNRDLRLTNGDRDVFTRALLSARVRLAGLERFARLSAYDRRLREHLVQCVELWAERTHQTLESSLQKNNDQGVFLSLLRRTPLRPAVSKLNEQSLPATRPGDAPGRRILF